MIVCQYNISDVTSLPDHVKWSSNSPFKSPPAIGTEVKVTFNGLGTGVVDGYFWEHGYIGVKVVPNAGQRPAWHIKQVPAQNYYLVFGSEIESEDVRWEDEPDYERTGNVVAVMVGDDQRHIVDPDDLTLLGELDYCCECGQIGCCGDFRERPALAGKDGVA